MRPAFPLILAALLPLPLAGAAGPSHRDFRIKAEAAYERRDYPAALAATREALALRPDSPRYLYNLAALSVLTGDPAAALSALQQLANLGVVMPVERDPDFAPLQGTPEFRRILGRLAANREPRGQLTPLAELPGRTGIIEGIAHHSRTGDLFLSDVHLRCIWRRDRDGRLTRFTAEDDDLLGLFGLALDEARSSLWAAMRALPEMSGYTAAQLGYTGLAEFNLNTGEVRQIVPIPGDGRESAVGDLVVAADGTVYATDSKAPVIWKFIPGSEEAIKAAESPAFSSLQGIVLIRDRLIVADYSNGLFAVDPRRGGITALPAPAGTTLLGLDGLVAIPGGLIATQNGLDPSRVLRINLNAALDAITGVSVLAAGQPILTDITLITLANDHPTLIAGSGWDRFDPAKAGSPDPHTVRILQVAIP